MSQLLETASGPLNCVVEVPGSKSIANRALICAALAGAGSRITNVPDGDDTVAMLEALRILGVTISQDEGNVNFSSALDLENTHEVSVHAALAGTSSRFLTALGALRKGNTLIDGFEALRQRPMQDLHVALQKLGATVASELGMYSLPVVVNGASAHGGELTLSSSVSSQFSSAILLIAPYLSSGLSLNIEGERVSESYVMMTIGVMRAFGVDVSIEAQEDTLLRICVQPGKYSATQYFVEPDASSASYPLAAVAICGGEVFIPGMKQESLQGDTGFVSLMEKMGCVARWVDNGVYLERDPHVMLQGLSVDLKDMSDLVPTVAAVALFAQGASTITGVGFIRNKESDRLGDLASELHKCGAEVKVFDDGIVITPRPLRGAELATHHDHRLAMAFGLVALQVPEVLIQEPEVVSKSWPMYWEMREQMLRSCRE
ncbi:3-phosphoshikimate 1-carboxyvinyltransferase [bacterium]|nr:3-phosphoshikimate 1-carboxyvinyltransferase [bacterium]